MAITYEQVASTAEQIKAEGVKPTVQRVRDRIGGGSFSTLTQLVKKWKEEQPQQVVTEEPVPDDLAALFSKHIELKVSKRLTSIRDELADTVQVVDGLTVECDQLKAQVEADSMEIKGLETAFSSADRQLTELEEKFKRAVEDRIEYRDRAERLTLDLATSTARVEALSAERDELKKAAQNSAESILKLTTNEARLTSQNESLNASLMGIREQLENANAELKTTVLDLADHKARNTSLDEKISQRDELISELKASKSDLEKALSEAHKTASQFEGKYEALLDEIKLLKKESGVEKN